MVSRTKGSVIRLKPTWVLISAIVVAHTVALGFAAMRDSPTWDETAHLPAGLSNWRYGNFDLYRVNPPLVRMIAAVPVALLRPEIGWRPSNASQLLRQDSAAGKEFFQRNGSRAFWYLTLARWACIPFSILGALVCWRWATRLYGQSAGLVALTLWCICPSVLGHGHLITPDIGAAALGVSAGYLYWRWLRDSTWGNAVAAGLGLGLVELTKTSWVLLFGLWPAMWIVWTILPVQQRTEKTWHLQVRQLSVMLLVGLYTLNAGYGFEGAFTRLADYRFRSDVLRGDNSGDIGVNFGNRFSENPIGLIPVPLPRNYVQGIDQQKRNFEQPDSSYLRGQWRSAGWYYYYAYAMLIKMPIGTVLLLALALASEFIRPGRMARHGIGPVGSATWTDELVLLLPAVLMFVLVSSQTGFNRHLRYVLPAFPFLFVWCGRLTQWADFRWTTSQSSTAVGYGRELPRVLSVVIVASVCWATGSTLWIFPHSLCYFNESVGGPTKGHWHLYSSNVDWGQDLFYVKDWYDRHPTARPFHFEFRMPLIDPSLAGIEYESVPTSLAMNRSGKPKTRWWPWGDIVSSAGPDVAEGSVPADRSLLGPMPGWYAISVAQTHRPLGEYEYFTEFVPVDRIGYTTLVYHITLDDANRLRNKLGLPEVDPEVAPDALVPTKSSDQ